jgi:hypothetical protein
MVNAVKPLLALKLMLCVALETLVSVCYPNFLGMAWKREGSTQPQCQIISDHVISRSGGCHVLPLEILGFGLLFLISRSGRETKWKRLYTAAVLPNA